MKNIIISLLSVIVFGTLNFSEIYATTELNLNCRNAILYDRTSKRVLFEKDAYTKVPNASTTKILTAIVAYENCDITEIAEIGQNAVSVTGSKEKFRKGDKISINDLMNGMLLCSGNDAAIAIAEHVGGTVDEFCKMMNKKAKEIGATNTNFVTPHGLDEEGHYSTAYDLALLADYALNIPYLANIFAKKTETIFINGSPRNISTTNEMLYLYEGANGVKTGFTNDAGRCLITSATNSDGWQLISVVLGCDTKNFRTQDSKKILDYGFEKFKLVNIGEILPSCIIFEVEKSLEQMYKIEFSYEQIYPLKEEEFEKIYYKEEIKENMIAPITKNSEIAKYGIFIRKRKNCGYFFEN